MIYICPSQGFLYVYKEGERKEFKRFKISNGPVLFSNLNNKLVLLSTKESKISLFSFLGNSLNNQWSMDIQNLIDFPKNSTDNQSPQLKLEFYDENTILIFNFDESNGKGSLKKFGLSNTQINANYSSFSLDYSYNSHKFYDINPREYKENDNRLKFILFKAPNPPMLFEQVDTILISKPIIGSTSSLQYSSILSISIINESNILIQFRQNLIIEIFDLRSYRLINMIRNIGKRESSINYLENTNMVYFISKNYLDSSSISS